MAIEFSGRTDVALSPSDLQHVAQRLEGCGRYELETVDVAEVRLRYRGFPRREGWPEDVVIRNDAGLVSLVVHTGSLTQVSAAVADVQSALSDLGKSVKLQEE